MHTDSEEWRLGNSFTCKLSHEISAVNVPSALCSPVYKHRVTQITDNTKQYRAREDHEQRLSR